MTEVDLVAVDLVALVFLLSVGWQLSQDQDAV